MNEVVVFRARADLLSLCDTERITRSTLRATEMCLVEDFFSTLKYSQNNVCASERSFRVSFTPGFNLPENFTLKKQQRSDCVGRVPLFRGTF